MSRPPDEDTETPLLRQANEGLRSPGSAACPDADELAALAVGQTANRERIADHVVSCRQCGADYRILLELHKEASPPLRPRASALAWLAVASVVLAAAAGALLVLRAGRGAGGEEAIRGTAAGRIAISVVPAAGATLGEPPARLAWPGQKSAEGYRVKLFGASGETLWESERISTPSIDIPPAALSFGSGRSYFWTVEVETPLEKARLGPFWFTLR
jgi:hypothetical protein